MYVSLRMCSPWTREGLAPPGLGLYSHVRSDDPGLPACQGNIILGDDAYTPHEEAISPRREARIGRKGGNGGQQEEG